jgi:hypothetical protein
MFGELRLELVIAAIVVICLVAVSHRCFAADKGSLRRA